jgi:UMF1 family MFS transporter
MFASLLDAVKVPPPSEGVQQRPPRYAGEDTTSTSRREILGWYAYGMAAEVFAVCGVGPYLLRFPPLQQAQELNDRP